MSLNSYPSIFNIAHKAVSTLLQGPVIVQEKVDGSQFSFKREGGIVYTHSKGARIYPETADKLFKGAVDYVNEIKDRLTEGYTYRGEVLCRPKHNTLAYDRVPKHNIVIFDIDGAEENYFSPRKVTELAEHLDLEVVPLLWEGTIDFDNIKGFLQRTSFLGGQLIEGVVIKPSFYTVYGPDKKVLMAKLVSEAFKEIHGGEWRKNNPNKQEAIVAIAMKYKTPARWNKAIQHVREAGQLSETPADIGKLLKEIQVDVLKECEAEIKEDLFEHFWPQVSRMLIGGFPEYYKKSLLDNVFGGTK